jgi:periplasmic protein TonB
MMKMILVSAFALLISQVATAQSNAEETPSAAASIVDSPPQYVGGDVALYTFVYQRLKFPSDAEMTECTVYVGFTVNEDGSLKNIAVKKGFNRGYNEEAVRVVAAMPRWRAGRHQGKATKVAWVIPIRFKLS